MTRVCVHPDELCMHVLPDHSNLDNDVPIPEQPPATHLACQRTQYAEEESRNNGTLRVSLVSVAGVPAWVEREAAWAAFEDSVSKQHHVPRQANVAHVPPGEAVLI